jgi:hypothetical protein
MHSDDSSQQPGNGSQPASADAGLLLDGLLGSLLEDFRFWFERGQVLLAHCPDTVMPAEARADLALQLDHASRELAAASSLRQAAPTAMALEMGTLAPWHNLVLEIWGLSARLRLAEVPLPAVPLRPESQGPA